MDRETIDEHVEEAAEHAERATEHHEEERRLEGQAQATRGAEEDALEQEAELHGEAAAVEEDESEEAADAASNS
jgi:hypothetical protein